MMLSIFLTKVRSNPDTNPDTSSSSAPMQCDCKHPKTTEPGEQFCSPNVSVRKIPTIGFCGKKKTSEFFEMDPIDTPNHIDSTEPVGMPHFPIPLSSLLRHDLIESIHEATHVRVNEEDWRDNLPSESSSRFPKNFQGVLKLMDELVHRESCGLSKDLSFFKELYDNRSYGYRKGEFTRISLRALQKKKDQRVAWKRWYWSPKKREHLASFIEVLIEITKRATKFKENQQGR